MHSQKPKRPWPFTEGLQRRAKNRDKDHTAGNLGCLFTRKKNQKGRLRQNDIDGEAILTVLISSSDFVTSITVLRIPI